MNRQIIFRGKRIDNGEWVYGYLLHGDVIRGKGIAIYKGNTSWCEVSCHAYVVIPETVGQFTGLCDTTPWEDLTELERERWTLDGNFPSQWKGRKIYEGDILGFTSPIKPFGTGRKHTVRYVKDGFWAVGTVKESDGTEFGDMLARKLKDEAETVEYMKEECSGQLSFGVIGNIHDNPDLLTTK
jgi:hypothetical protein